MVRKKCFGKSIIQRNRNSRKNREVTFLSPPMHGLRRFFLCHRQSRCSLFIPSDMRVEIVCPLAILDSSSDLSIPANMQVEAKAYDGKIKLSYLSIPANARVETASKMAKFYLAIFSSPQMCGLRRWRKYSTDSCRLFIPARMRVEMEHDATNRNANRFFIPADTRV